MMGGGNKKSIVGGLMTGAALSAAMVFWFFQENAPSNFREPAGRDDGSTLGFQLEKLPSVALRPRSIDDIARRVGFKDSQDALKATLMFADRVRIGVLTESWQAACKETEPAFLCAGVEDYFAPRMMPSLGGAPTSSRKSRRGGIVFSKKNIANLQRENVNEQMRRFPDWSWRQIQSYAELALKTTDCPRNFSISLGRQIEEFLKQPGAFALMDQLDLHGQECLKGDEPWAEFILQRSAFMKLGRAQYKEAIPLLERALQASYRKEESRSLYWLSLARKNAGQVKEAKASLDALWKSYPLSWHTLSSRAQEGQDPLQPMRDRPLYADEYESGDQALDRRVLWLQLLIALNENSFVVRQYGEFVVKSFGPTLKPGFVQHLARIFNYAGLYRLQILALSNVVYSRPDIVTMETLRLLYPRPYFEELQQREARLDTTILLGLARQESGFDPNATSRADARGLMQLLPSTARSLHKGRAKNLHNYEDNIALGSLFLMKLIKYFDGSVEKTLAAYNAGQTIVNKWSGRFDFVKEPQLFMDLIPYRETREYVPSILRNAYWYHRLFPEMTRSLVADVKTSDLLRLQLAPFMKQLANEMPAKERNPSATSK